MKMPFSTEPSKEARCVLHAINGLFYLFIMPGFKKIYFLSTPLCRMLEQLRKQQGSVLHPNYSAPFNSFEDTLHRLLPYHLYQGTANSSQDYQRGNKLLNLQCNQNTV